MKDLKLEMVRMIYHSEHVQVMEVYNKLGDSTRKAVKKIALTGGDKCRKLDDIVREVTVMSCARHPHVMPLEDSVHYGDSVLLYMPLCSQRLDQMYGTISSEKLGRYFVQTASALKYLHDISIVHGDVKGANILIDDLDNAVLADFDCAVMLQKHKKTVSVWRGTIGFIAPEAYTMEKYNAFLMDSYALGATLWSMLFQLQPPNNGLITAVILNTLIEFDYRYIMQMLLTEDPAQRFTVKKCVEFLRNLRTDWRRIIDSTKSYFH